MIKIDRRVDLEVQEEIKALELGVYDAEDKEEQKTNVSVGEK